MIWSAHHSTVLVVLSAQFELRVANISVVVEQEVTTPSLRTFPAVSLAMGKYSSTALFLELQNWSSKVRHDVILFVY